MVMLQLRRYTKTLVQTTSIFCECGELEKLASFIDARIRIKINGAEVEQNQMQIAPVE